MALGTYINRFYIFLPTLGRSRLLLVLERLKKKTQPKKEKIKKPYINIWDRLMFQSRANENGFLLVLFRIQFSRTVFSMVSSESSETRDKLKSPIWRKLPAMHEISASGLSAITLEKSRAYNPVIKPSVDKWEGKWTAVDHWGLLTTPFGQTLSPRVDLRWNALTLVTAEIFSCNDAEFGSERNLWLWSILPLCNNWVHGLHKSRFPRLPPS